MDLKLRLRILGADRTSWAESSTSFSRHQTLKGAAYVFDHDDRICIKIRTQCFEDSITMMKSWQLERSNLFPRG